MSSRKGGIDCLPSRPWNHHGGLYQSTSLRSLPVASCLKKNGASSRRHLMADASLCSQSTMMTNRSVTFDEDAVTVHTIQSLSTRDLFYSPLELERMQKEGSLQRQEALKEAQEQAKAERKARRAQRKAKRKARLQERKASRGQLEDGEDAQSLPCLKSTTPGKKSKKQPDNISLKSFIQASRMKASATKRSSLDNEIQWKPPASHTEHLSASSFHTTSTSSSKSTVATCPKKRNAWKPPSRLDGTVAGVETELSTRDLAKSKPTIRPSLQKALSLHTVHLPSGNDNCLVGSSSCRSLLEQSIQQTTHKESRQKLNWWDQVLVIPEDDNDKKKDDQKKDDKKKKESKRKVDTNLWDLIFRKK